MHHGREIRYLRANPPDENSLDIKAMEIQDKLPNRGAGMTEWDMYNSIQIVPPVTTTVVAPIDVEKGQYKLVDVDFYNSLPRWEWNAILKSFNAHSKDVGNSDIEEV